jgi:hypothetical protein
VDADIRETADDETEQGRRHDWDVGEEMWIEHGPDGMSLASG